MNLLKTFVFLAICFFLLSIFSTYQNYRSVMEIKRISIENAELIVENIGLGINLTTSEINHVIKDLSYLEDIKDARGEVAQNEAVMASKLEDYFKLNQLQKEQRANLQKSKILLEKTRTL